MKLTRPVSTKPMVRRFEPKMKLQDILKDTQTNTGSGSNATGERQVEREPRGINNPALIPQSDGDGRQVAENDAGLQAAAAAGSADATLNPAMRTLAPSATPATLSNKQKAKELAEIIKAVAPIYEKHGKRIAGVILPRP